jgi:hypothetical protein
VVCLPADRATDGLTPIVEQAIARVGADRGRKNRRLRWDAPVFATKPGYRQHRGARCAGLGEATAHHRPADHIGLKLHQEVIAGRAAIGCETLERMTEIGLHCGKDVGDPKSDGFDRRTGKMGWPRAEREAGDQAAGFSGSVGRTETYEGGNE